MAEPPSADPPRAGAPRAVPPVAVPLPDALPDSPWELLSAWLAEAQARVAINPLAMALASCDRAARPSVRMVLVRRIDGDEAPGTLSFYTHSESRKGRELEASGRAAGVLYWPELGRQVRVEGKVGPASDDESDAYFAGRPRSARLAAWASPQSRPIASRRELLERLADVERRFGPDGEVPRPARWGGYRLVTEEIELWTEGGPGRLHDRARWTWDTARGAWTSTRLAP